MRSRTEVLLPNHSLSHLACLKNRGRRLKRNSLTGFMPTQLGNLEDLAKLDVGDNSLSGSIPSELGALARVSSLTYHRNRMSGILPASLASLTQLSWLDGSFNAISGTFPSGLVDVTELTAFNMRSCALSGTIPAFLPHLPSIVTLALSQNSLSGTVPANFASGLEGLYLFGNVLSGSLPASLAGLQNLTVCPLNAAQSGFPTHVNTNQFTCPLPSLPACDVTCVGPPSPPPPVWPPASPPPMDCLDTCTLENGYHTECWDGGPGSEGNLCDSGTDCFNCGPRYFSPPPSPPPPFPPPPSSPPLPPPPPRPPLIKIETEALIKIAAVFAAICSGLLLVIAIVCCACCCIQHHGERRREARARERVPRLLATTDVPVHLISTPFASHKGFVMAEEVKREHDLPPGEHCYNPNTE